MQNRSWIVVGPNIFGYSHPSEIYNDLHQTSNIIQHIYHLGAEPQSYIVPAADDADLFHAGGEQHTKTWEPQAPLCNPDKKRDGTSKPILSRPD